MPAAEEDPMPAPQSPQAPESDNGEVDLDVLRAQFLAANQRTRLKANEVAKKTRLACEAFEHAKHEDSRLYKTVKFKRDQVLDEAAEEEEGEEPEPQTSDVGEVEA